MKSHNPEKAEAFVAEAREDAKKLIAHFKNLEFYTSKSGASESMEKRQVIILTYGEDQITPYLRLWKDGLRVCEE